MCLFILTGHHTGYSGPCKLYRLGNPDLWHTCAAPSRSILHVYHSSANNRLVVLAQVSSATDPVQIWYTPTSCSGYKSKFLLNTLSLDTTPPYVTISETRSGSVSTLATTNPASASSVASIMSFEVTSPSLTPSTPKGSASSSIKATAQQAVGGVQSAAVSTGNAAKTAATETGKAAKSAASKVADLFGRRRLMQVSYN
jgi:hypothetical protein